MCAVASQSSVVTGMMESSNLEDPVGAFTPTADLGVDFEVILRMCLEEQQRKDQSLESSIPCHNEKQESDSSVPDYRPSETEAPDSVFDSPDIKERGDGWEIIAMPTDKSQSLESDLFQPMARTTIPAEGVSGESGVDSSFVLLSCNRDLSDDFPILDRKPATRKHKARFNKVRLKRKKWVVTSDLICFDYFPNRDMMCVEDDICMEKALEQFEESLSTPEKAMDENLSEGNHSVSNGQVKCSICEENGTESVSTSNTELTMNENQSEGNHSESNGQIKCNITEETGTESVSTSNSEMPKCGTTEGNGLESVPQLSVVRDIQKKRKKHKKSHSVQETEHQEEMFNLENKLSRQQWSKIECYLYSRCVVGENFRKKHKWHDLKARRAVKDNHCMTLHNNPHGRKLFMNHRQTLLNIRNRSLNYIPTPFTLKRIHIDQKVRVKTIYTPSTRQQIYRPATRDDDYAMAVPFAINGHNADNGLDRDLVNVLMTMQNRDLTPEDYDLLLRLDERVGPKTLETDVISGFKVDQAAECDVLEACPVCMDFYQVGDERKYLPCNHYFHTECIERWLANSSMNCPLDGLPVTPS